MPEFADIQTSRHDSRYLRAGDFFEVHFRPVGKKITVYPDGGEIDGGEIKSAVSFAIANDDLPETGGGGDRIIEDPEPPKNPLVLGSIQIDLFPPDSSNPIFSIVTKGTAPFEENSIHFNLENVDKSLLDQRWKCRFTNVRDTNRVICNSHIFFTKRLGELHTTAIPFRILNHAARQFIAALALDTQVVGDKLVITVSDEITRFSGGAIKSKTIPAKAGNILANGEIEYFEVTHSSVKAFKGDSGNPIIRFELKTHSHVDLDILLVFDKDIHDLAITVDFELRPQTPHDVSNKPPANNKIVYSAFVKTNFGLEDKIKDFFEAGDLSRKVSEFLTEGFTQLAQRGHRFYDMSANRDNILIHHYAPKKEVDLGPFTTGKINPTGGGPKFGELPGVENLEKIDHIVFLMMENRSFDHMLGYLRLHGGRKDVDGLRGNERNLTTGTFPVELTHLRKRRFLPDPPHGFDAVKRQIDDGRMSGFVETFSDRHPLEPPDLIMGYHKAGHVPTYDFFANHFVLCDRWFCSHPGPTQPNRFCTWSGMAPFVDNFKIDDPALGYLRFLTIFDSLTALGIDWVYYESDLSFLRMMDRYRLDDKHIMPLRSRDDNFDDFFERVNRPGAKKLPPVTFIDPDFIDVPIGKVSTDDHAPSNIADGQRFVAKIYNALHDSPIWEKTLFVITYDEHGGFFDHVAPPGTTVWNSNPKNKQFEVAKVHPDGRSFLGVRVPAFVISPWVEKGVVSSTIFDHTSIMKTILLKFRDKDFPDFGPRVAQAEHWGTLLTRAEPRKNIPEIEISKDHDNSEQLPKNFKPDKSDPRDFHLAMQNFGKPLPGFKISDE